MNPTPNDAINLVLNTVLDKIDATYGKDYRSPEIDHVKKIINDLKESNPSEKLPTD